MIPFAFQEHYSKYRAQGWFCRVFQMDGAILNYIPFQCFYVLFHSHYLGRQAPKGPTVAKAIGGRLLSHSETQHKYSTIAFFYVPHSALRGEKTRGIAMHRRGEGAKNAFFAPSPLRSGSWTKLDQPSFFIHSPPRIRIRSTLPSAPSANCTCMGSSQNKLDVPLKVS